MRYHSTRIAFSAALFLVGFSTECGTPPDSTGQFASFWSEFRRAVLAQEQQELRRLVRFPVETRGPSDDDPIVTVGEAEFPEVLAMVLNQDTGARAEPETVRQFLERTVEPTPGSMSEDGEAARLGPFAFSWQERRWLLTRIYREDQ